MNIDLVIALYGLATDWHSGQRSRGYHLFCTVYNYARRRGIDVQRTTRTSRRLYRQLEQQYADKL